MLVHFVSSGKSTTEGAKIAENRRSRIEDRAVARKAILDLRSLILDPQLLRFPVVGFQCFGASLATT
jgi:hypothetical protein